MIKGLNFLELQSRHTKNTSIISLGITHKKSATALGLVTGVLWRRNIY